MNTFDDGFEPPTLAETVVVDAKSEAASGLSETLFGTRPTGKNRARADGDFGKDPLRSHGPLLSYAHVRRSQHSRGGPSVIVLRRGVLPTWWTERFGEVPPLGYKLREAYADRWLRIHSLPESKRYPETEQEMKLLLRRHAKVASQLLSLAEPCLIVRSLYEGAQVGATRPFDEFDERPFECIASMRHPDADDEAIEPWDISFWVNSTNWDPELERTALVATANDELRAIWFNPQSGEIYAPYDGGADVILRETKRRERLKAMFADWLSARPDGL